MAKEIRLKFAIDNSGTGTIDVTKLTASMQKEFGKVTKSIDRDFATLGKSVERGFDRMQAVEPELVAAEAVFGAVWPGFRNRRAGIR